MARYEMVDDSAPKGRYEFADDAPTAAKPVEPISFLGRVGQGAKDVVNGASEIIAHVAPGYVDAANSLVDNARSLPVIGSLLPKTVPASQVDQHIANEDAQYQSQRAASGSTGFDGGRTLGAVAASAPLMFANPAAGAGTVVRAAVGAGTGALSSMLSPVKPTGDSFGRQKLDQAGIGALIGGAAAPVAAGLGKVVAGFGDSAQQALAKAGVTMTPGQIMGGMIARTEEKASSIPVLGDAIKAAQQRALQDMNRAAYNEVLAPLGKKYMGPVGTEGVKQVRNTISQSYDNALSKLTFSAHDPQFASDITNLGALAQNLPQDQAKTFTKVLQNQIFGKVGPQGTMDGQSLKGMQGELSNMARGYAGDPSFDNRQLGHAIGEIKNAVDASLSRTNPADAVKELADANSAYASYVRLRSAAGSMGAGNNDGVFTGAQLNSAVRANDKSVGKGAFATGNARMQDLSTAAQKVLGSKYPDSGTAGRLAIPGLLAAGASAVAAPGAALAGAGLAGASMLPYTTVGQKLMQGALMARPASAQQVGQDVAKYGSLLGSVLGPALLGSSK